jgi:hypothetical protein
MLIFFFFFFFFPGKDLYLPNNSKELKKLELFFFKFFFIFLNIIFFLFKERETPVKKRLDFFLQKGDSHIFKKERLCLVFIFFLILFVVKHFKSFQLLKTHLRIIIFFLFLKKKRFLKDKGSFPFFVSKGNFFFF